MAFQRVDISGGQVSGVSDLSSAPSSLVNFDVDDSGANWPRAALTSYSVTGSRSVGYNGAISWDQHLILAHTDGYLVAIPNAVPTTASVLSTSTATTQIVGGERPTFVAARNYVYAAGGHQIVRWSPSTITPDTLASSPRCTHIASLGQYLIANNLDNPHNWVWSDIGEGAWGTWPAANTTNAASEPDPVVALTATMDYVYVWGTETLQVYQLGSDPSLPFDLIQTIRTGIGAPYAFVKDKARVWFLDGDRQIVDQEGGSISGAIQKDLRGLSSVEGCWGYRLEHGQYSKLVWRFPAASQTGRTFVYDLGSQRWREDRYYQAPFQRDMPIGAYVNWRPLGKHIIGADFATGGLYEIDDTVRVENGSVPIVCERVTGWHDHGTMNRKRSGRLRVVLKRGTSTDPDVSDQGALEIRVQDDDQPWTDWEQVNIGDPTDYGNTVDVFIGGVFRRRRYGLRYSSSEPAAVAELHDEIEAVAA